jgi:hypothetical protein
MHSYATPFLQYEYHINVSLIGSPSIVMSGHPVYDLLPLPEAGSGAGLQAGK